MEKYGFMTGAFPCNFNFVEMDGDIPISLESMYKIFH